MAVLEILGSIFFLPVIFTVCLVSFLSMASISFGWRRKYVQKLVQIFQWAENELNENQERQSDRMTEIRKISKQFDSLELTGSNCNGGILFNDKEKRNVIKREASARISAKLNNNKFGTKYGTVFTFADDSLDFIKSGMEAIIEDEVTSRFLTQDLATWNLLTRTQNGNFSVSQSALNWKLTLLWMSAFMLRYGFLLPLRIIIFSLGLLYLIISTAFIGYLPKGRFKEWFNYYASISAYRIIACCVSAVITFHNEENKAKNGGICVANHTSPIDALILANDNCYAMIGQRHGGLLGIIQRALSRASNHIWFERGEANDRLAVSMRMRKHVADEKNLPILIFPEGTCINNSAVMMFKKGSFEIDCPIYPVAIRYDKRFGDAFWNSSEDNWSEYMMKMMTSWAIVVNVIYLPVMMRQPSENAIDFAARVKRVIAEAGGLVELNWDGQLKRHMVSQKAREEHQLIYSRRLVCASETELESIALSKSDEETNDEQNELYEVKSDSVLNEHVTHAVPGIIITELQDIMKPVCPESPSWHPILVNHKRD